MQARTCRCAPPAHASRRDTQPSDRTTGSVANPVLAGGGASFGQRKLSGRSAGKGLMLTASLWLPPRHIRLPCWSRPATIAMWPPPLRFIGANAPTGGPASLVPQLDQSSAHNVSVPCRPAVGPDQRKGQPRPGTRSNAAIDRRGLARPQGPRLGWRASGDRRRLMATCRGTRWRRCWRRMPTCW